MAIRMIATDLDGTLLLPDKTTSPRTRHAIRAAQEAGILVIPATGRSVIDMPAILPPELGELAVCSNGAVVYNATADQVLLERPISAGVCKALIKEVSRLAPGTKFATLIDRGYEILPGPGYLSLMQPGNHGRNPDDLDEVSLDELWAQDAVKIIVRHATVGLGKLLEICRQASHVGVNPTTSGVPFIEMSAAGVSKASTLELLATRHGIATSEVAAIGDSANDVEMITWAGHGVAVASGTPDALAAADQIIAANTEDGVAAFIERVLHASDEPVPS